MKTTAEKTTSFLGGLGSGLSAKLGAVKNSDTFRSLEEKVGSAYSNVKVSNDGEWEKFSLTVTLMRCMYACLLSVESRDVALQFEPRIG